VLVLALVGLMMISGSTNVLPETAHQIRVIKEQQAPWIEEFEEQVDTGR